MEQQLQDDDAQFDYALWWARQAVFIAQLGAPVGDWQRTVKGTAPVTLRMSFKHSQIMQVALQIAAYGSTIFDEEDPQNWWGLALAEDEWRLPPDYICAETFPLIPLGGPADGLALLPLEAIRTLYTRWAAAFWSNTTTQQLVEELTELLTARPFVLGPDITALLAARRAALGPGTEAGPV